MSGLWKRMKERKLVQWPLAYLAAAWLLVQVCDVLGAQFGWSAGVLRGITLAFGTGFFLVLIAAWYHGEKGRQKAGAMELSLIALVLAVGGVLLWQFAPSAPQTQDAAAALSEKMPESAAAQAPVPDKSVAVLPFLALSHGPDDEHFADGLTEELLNSLAALPDLRVTARTSSFHFKGKDVPVPEIAKALGVAHVVEGSVRRAGDRLRITAQLIRAGDGFHLWSQSYDRDMADVFAVQLDIATHIAEALDVLLDESRVQRMRDAGIRDVEAFVEYQKGYAGYIEAHKFSGEERNRLLVEANRHFDLAIARVPGFAAAYFYRADLPIHQSIDAANGEAGGEVDLVAARERLSADLAAASSQAHEPLQRAKADYLRMFLSDDWRGLAQTLDRMLSDDTCFPIMYEDRTAAFGRAAAIAALMRDRLECDPLDPDNWGSLLTAISWGGDPEAVLATAEAAEARIGAHHWIEAERIHALLALRRFDEAQRRLVSPALTGRERENLRIAVLAASGRGDQARAAASALLDDAGDDLRHLWLAAWTGDRAAANVAAARIDARPLAAAALTWATEECSCGAPFDLSATPNFAARLAESGLPWPPYAPIRFPEKDWP